MTRAALAAALLLGALLPGCAPKTPPLGHDRLFISDEGQNRVIVLDGDARSTLRTGKRPRGIELSPDQNILYVAASDSNRIEAWDTRTLKHLRDYDSGPDPERFAVSPDGATIAIANEDDSAISFLDLASGKITRDIKVGPEPEGVGISPDAKLVVATSEAASTAHFIDVRSGKLLDSIIVGSRPRHVLFLKKGKQVWVSSEQRGTISIFDSATRHIVATVDLVPAFPDVEQVQAVEMRATRDGQRIFVAMGRGDRVAEIDPVTRKVVRSWPVGHRNWGINLSPDGRRLYAVAGLSGDLTIIDLVDNKLAGTMKLGGKPWGVVAVRKP